MAFDIVRATLASALAAGGTLTVNYPTGQGRGPYQNALGHIIVAGNQVYTAPAQFTVTLNAASFVITLGSGLTTIPAGTTLLIQLQRQGADLPAGFPSVAMANANLVSISLGSPIAAAANAHLLSAALTLASGGVTAFTGALAGTNDVPRNIVAAWTNTAVLTVRGFDQYGNAMTESSGSGTSFTGAKAFARITRVSVSADVTGLTVGTGVVLGLPVYLPAVANLIRESVDGAVPTAGTTVAGVQTVQTATTGDVRGTYNPNSAPDGSRSYVLLCALPDPTNIGVAQFGG